MHESPVQPDASWALPPPSGSEVGSSDAQPSGTGKSRNAPTLPGLPDSAVPGSADSAATSYIFRQFQQLADANRALQDEISRCYDRLNVVVEMSQDFSSLEDPATLRTALFSRYSDALDAAALLLDHQNGRVSVRLRQTGPRPLAVAPSQIWPRLAPEIDAVLRTRRACYVNLPQARERGLGEVHALLSILQEDSERPHVVIALRRGEQPPFGKDDQLAAETVLIHGGHLLRNVQMVRRLQQASLETVGALANAIEARDKYTGGHSERVSQLAVLTGKALHLPASELQTLEWAGLLHDIGKIGIPEHILSKPGALTAEEFDQIKQHARLGYEVLRPVASLQPVLDAVLYHHENHDGSGYPEELRGEQIPLSARILHVVDIFDALISSRSYRGRLSMEEALQVLTEGTGSITDPAVTTAFVHALRHRVTTQPDEFSRRFEHL